MAPERHYVSDEEWERMDTNERFQAAPQLVDWMKHLKPLEPTLSPEEKEQIAEDARLLAAYARRLEPDGPCVSPAAVADDREV